MNISDLALQVRIANESAKANVAENSDAAPQKEISKSEALRVFTQSLIRTLKLNNETIEVLRVLLRPIDANINLSRTSEAKILQESDHQSTEKIRNLIKNLFTLQLSQIDTRENRSATFDSTIRSNESLSLLKTIEAAIRALSSDNTASPLVSAEEYRKLIESLLDGSSMNDFISLLKGGSDSISGDFKRLLQLLSDKVEDPVVSLLFQLSGFKESIDADAGSSSRTISVFIDKLMDDLSTLRSSKGSDEAIKRVLNDGRDEIEKIIISHAKDSGPESILKNLQSLKRSVDFFLDLPVLTDTPSDALKQHLEEIKKHARDLLGKLHSNGHLSEESGIRKNLELLERSISSGDSHQMRNYLEDLSRYLDAFSNDYSAGYPSMDLPHGDPRLSVIGKYSSDIQRSAESLKQLIRKVIQDLSSNDEALGSADYQKMAREISDELVELSKSPNQSTENQILLKKLSERLLDSSLKKDEALSVLKRSEQLVSRMSEEILKAEPDGASSIERMIKGQEFLQTINPLMAKLGEPLFMFFPSLIDGLLSKVEVSLFKADGDLNPGADKKKGSSKGAYNCAAVSLNLPHLGKLTVHAAHRASELLVMITSSDENVSNFLEENRVDLSRRLAGLGFEKCEVVFRTASLVSTTPEWVERLVERSGIVA